MFLTDDETCFHVFEAASAQIVHEVCRRAELGSPRIVPAMEWAGNRRHEASARGRPTRSPGRWDEDG
jgi:hypothetical protein